MKENVLKSPRGRPVKLADGKTYILAPLSLNTLANLEDEFDCELDELEAKLKGRTATAFRKWLWVLLRENYPDMTLEETGKLVELSQMDAIMAELTATFDELKT